MKIDMAYRTLCLSLMLLITSCGSVSPPETAPIEYPQVGEVNLLTAVAEPEVADEPEVEAQAETEVELEAPQGLGRAP